MDYIEIVDSKENETKSEGTYRILIVDDDPDTLAVVEAGLKQNLEAQFSYEFVTAKSQKDAISILSQKDSKEFALAILDVVMENDDAGLKLVNYIRNSLKNSEIRIIIHTGQAKDMFEFDVIRKYDINDFLVKSKSDSSGLAHAVIFALRSFREVDRRVQEIQQMRADLVHTEKLSSLGTLASGIAHELNNSLNFISGGVNFLKKHTAQGPDSEKKAQALELLDVMQNGVKLSSSIIENLKSYSRKDSGTQERVDLLPLVKMVLVILKGMIGEEVEVKLDIPESFPVFVNRAGISQLLMNLIKNSVEAIEGKGSISISAKNQVDSWVLCVRDTGCGIPQELIGKIFDPFFTTKKVGQGTGLGLYVVHKEIERHHVKLSVESVVGSGTTFSLVFPSDTGSV